MMGKKKDAAVLRLVPKNGNGRELEYTVTFREEAIRRIYEAAKALVVCFEKARPKKSTPMKLAKGPRP
jgi:hypothetical protein